MDVQRQIRQNADEVQEYIQGLNSWVDDMKKNEKNFKTSPQKPIPPIRNSNGAGSEGDNITLSLKEKDKGNEFFNQGKYSEAVGSYTRAISLDPSNHILPANRALASLKLNNWKEAEIDCTTAILLNPQYVKAFQRRGVARLSLKVFDDAIKDFQMVLKLEPNNKQAMEDLQKALQQQQQHKQQEQQQQEQKQKQQQQQQQKQQQKQPPPPQPQQQQEQQQQPPQTQSPSATPISTTSPSNATVQTNTVQTNTKKSDAPVGKRMIIREVEGDDGGGGVSDTYGAAGQVEPSQRSTPSPSLSGGDKNKIEPSVPPKKEVIPSKPKITIALPSNPPKNAYEFERMWHSLSITNDLSTMAQYLVLSNPSNFSSLFKESLSSDVFFSIINVIAKYFIPEKDYSISFSLLSNMLKVGGFDMISMFMSSEEKQTISQILQKIQEEGDGKVEKAKIDEIKHKYGVP